MHEKTAVSSLIAEIYDLTVGYFGEDGMLVYVKVVQRQEIRKGVSCVKHQRMAGLDLGDDQKIFFAGDYALKAGRKNNISNQFGVKESVRKELKNIGKVALSIK